MKFRSRALRLVAAAAVTTGVLLPGTSSGASATSAYDEAYQLGLEAYKFGMPLLDMQRLFSTYRSVNVCADVNAYGPANTFCHGRRLLDASFRDVVAPNSDTVYSMATLSLPTDAQPMVVSIPSTPGRYHSVAVLDMWQDDVTVIGDHVVSLYPDASARPFARPDGDYIVASPGQLEGKLDGRSSYRGLPVIHVPHTDAWVLGRTILKNPADLADAHKAQDGYKVIPLNKYGKAWRPQVKGQVDDVVNPATIPGTTPGSDPIAFFDALGDLMVKYAPHDADQPLLDRLASVGIGVGLHPSATEDADTLAGLRDAVKAGPKAIDADIAALGAAGFNAHNGWLVVDTGRYGTDYTLRAIVDRIGLGALDGRVATYPVARTDRLGQVLTGTKRYVAHFAPGTFPPPVEHFWSLTMYDDNMFFVDNELDRYLLNDRSDLTVNPDGSVDLYLQAERPTDEAQVANWLPAPASGDPTNPTQAFRLITRLYGITPSAFDGVMTGAGWDPPTILPCDETTGLTVTGWACAG